MFPLTVTVTLPVSHTTSKTFGEISKNGLFFIGGAWKPETWNLNSILRYTCIYQPSSDWYIRFTQQRKMILNIAIVRMVPHEPHCTFPLDHYHMWRKSDRAMAQFAVLPDTYHQYNGSFLDYQEKGWNILAVHAIMRRELP